MTTRRPILRALLGCGFALLVASFPARPAIAIDPIPTAIAEFDNFDTSGEDAERTARHAERVEGFADLLRDALAAQGKFAIRQLTCPQEPCTPARMPPDDFIQAGRDAGARLLVYGGIHKMSTLVQWGLVQAVDLETNALVVSQSFSFRGDTDDAFRRAADFVEEYLEDITLAP